MNYVEYLKSLGATDEDIKIFDTPLGRKAYEKMQADADAARSEGLAARDAAKKDRDQLQGWFNETAVPEFKDMERRAIAAEAETAKARAAWKAAQERGLIDNETSKALGWDTPAPGVTPPANPQLPQGFDPSKFVSKDDIRGVAESAGEGLATLQDIVLEHTQLFPERPIKFRELRREAVAAGKNVEQYWMEKYGVTAAREKKAADERAAWEKKLREEGAAQERAKFASYGNPELRPPVPSSFSFTKKSGAETGKQPWERQDDPSNDRVQRATQRMIEKQAGVTH